MNRREFMKRSAMAGATASFAPKAFESRVSPNDRITVGVLGSGARAQQLMEAAKAFPEVEVVAVCDAYSGRAQRAKERTGGKAKICNDYQEILNNKEVDTVIVGTPDHWHKIMAVESLEAGKDVYIEKPMTYVIDDGLEIIDAVKRTGRILQVGSQQSSNAVVDKAKGIVKSGKLGQITMVRAYYNRNTASGAWIYPIPPDASEKTVDWQKFLGPAPKRPFSLERFFRWRAYWDYSGGISTDLFVHLVTGIHYVLDAKAPSSVTATGELYRWKDSHEVPDTINGILVYPEGFTVNISSTFNNRSSGGSGYEILGTEGSITFTPSGMTFRKENVYEDNRWVVTSWSKEREKAYYADPKVQAKETPSTWKPEVKDESESWDYWGENPTVTHLRHFFESVKTRKQPYQDALVGHRAASCAHMINLSLRKRQTIYWDFAKEKIKA